jgi:hypothetical protein
MKPRLSIASLLGIVLACAAGLALLRLSSEFVASALLTATLGVLLVATLGAWMGLHRAFWRGVALFGWVYIILSQSPWGFAEVRPHLLTTKLLDGFQLLLNDSTQFLPTTRSTLISPPGNSFLFKAIAEPNPVSPVGVWGIGTDYEYYQQTGHSLFTLAIALAGGSIGRAFAAQRERTSRMPSGSPDPVREPAPEERSS